MNVEAALLRAIQDDPDDDLPRLAHADWLEESGQQPRAEFVRVQLERGRLDEEDDRQAALEARERRLYVRHAAQWYGGDVPNLADVRRGHREAIATTAGALPEDLDERHGREPIRRVLVAWSAAGFELGCWGHCRALERVEALSIQTVGEEWQHGVDLSGPLAACAWPRLRRLSVNARTVTGLGGLLDPAAWERWEELDLPNARLDSDTWERMLQRPGTRLCRVRVGNLFEEMRGGRRLFGSPLWEQLEGFDQVWLGDQASLAPALTRSRLRRLTVRDTGDLFTAHRWGDVTDLDLASALPNFGRLLGHPYLPRLRRLRIRAPLDPAGVQGLADCSGLSGLRELHLGESVGLLGALARSRHLRGLRRVEGASWEEQDDAAAFVRSPNAAHLRRLDPSYHLTGKLARAIAASGHLGELTTLNGYGAALTDGGAESLARSAKLPNLSAVNLRGADRLTAHGQRALLDADTFAWVGLRNLRDAGVERAKERLYGGRDWGDLLGVDW